MQQEHFDLDLERAILSSCIMSEDAYSSIAGDIEPKDFSLKAHQDVFKAIIACVNAGEPISISFLKSIKNRRANFNRDYRNSFDNRSSRLRQ